MTVASWVETGEPGWAIYRGDVASPAPRSLADELRSWSDDALAALLAARPDLATPLPSDLGALAVAAASRLSVQRTVDGLDAATFQVLEVLAVLPEPVSATQVGKSWGGNAKDWLDRLRALALVWGPPRALRLVRAARDVAGPYPAGLGPPLADALGRRSPRRLADVMEDLGLAPAGDPDVALATLSDHLGDPAVVTTLLDDAPPAARAVLDRLTWGPPIGQVDDADRPVRAGQAGSPIEWLLARGLLAVADAGHVVLPREIGIALREGRVHRERALTPPPLSVRDRDADQIDAAAGQAAIEAVRLVDELATAWVGLPPVVLRAGGIGVRELRRTASSLDLDERTAAVVAEVAFAAGLIAGDAEADPVWLPTPAYDLWQTAGIGQRWAQLAQAWLTSTRAAGLVGGRGPKDTPIAALGPDAERASAALLRGRVLTELAGVPGALADADSGGASLLARLDWAAPRRAGRTRAELVAWTLREAAWLGVTGLNALSGPGRRLLSGDDAAAATAMEAALPEAVDHILLQADLTAVLPGRADPLFERRLSEVADVESRGGATVYRFTAATVRRALDAGRTADDLTSWLADHSRTPVPQPLAYLITDSARRHGRLRVGTASSYLRAEDEATLAELLADRRTAPLRLRRLAPTVVAAQAGPDVVLKVLREMGLSPAAESPDGDLLIRRPPARRARGADRTPRRTQPPTPSADQLMSAIRTIRAVDEHARAPRRPVPDGDGPALEPMDTAGALAVIRAAVAARQDVWIGYLEDAGRPVRRIVEPLSVDGGRVRALERSSGKVRNYSVHRLIAVASAGRRSGGAGLTGPNGLNGLTERDQQEQEG